MGLIGLRKFIDASGCTRLLPVPLSEQEEQEQEQRRRRQQREQDGVSLYGDEEQDDYKDEEESGVDQPSASSSSSSTPVADHVLVDMNCIVHSCFGKNDIATKSRKELIQDVLNRLCTLLTQVVVARKSVTICLDGPAPIAKIQTQRLRRRRVSLLDTAGTHQLTSLAITAGSLFMVELENALAAQLKLNHGRGFLKRGCPVFLHGTTVMGEGEAKISRALAFLASGGSARQQEECAGKYKQVYSAPYNPNDSIIIIGNDIDLVISCLGATFYHNISIIGPSSLQLINVSDILYRWLKASAATRGDASRITVAQLPSVRVDFVFLFLLNGGDHYVGAGDIAMSLWRRYRTVRAAYPQSTLVSPNLDAIDVEFLADVLNTAEYTGDADVQVGMDLLHAALWSLYTAVTGVCPDYHFAPPESTPNLSHLRAAAAYCQRGRKRIRLSYVEGSVPLTPLETFVALMPSEAALPKSIATTLRQPRHHALSRVLLSSNSAKDVARCAREVVEVSAAMLTTSEQYLRDFTQPVQLNVVPHRRRLPRYEQHRMMARGGQIELEDPVPVVQRVEMPEYMEYTQLHYPPHVTSLSFQCPFDRHERDAESARELVGNAVTKSYYSSGSGNDSGAVPKASSSSSVADVSRKVEHLKKKIVLLKEEEEPSAASGGAAALSPSEKLQQTLEETSFHIKKGRQLQPKALRKMKRTLNKLQLQSDKRLREEASKEDHHYRLSKRGKEEFVDELQQFLGEDGDAAELLMDDDENTAAIVVGGYERNNKNEKGKAAAAIVVQTSGGSSRGKKQRRLERPLGNGTSRSSSNSSVVRPALNGHSNNDKKKNKARRGEAAAPQQLKRLKR